MESAYKTIFKSAVLVICGVIPIIGLQASERKRVRKAKTVNGETVNVEDVRMRTMQHLQVKWNTETCGRWSAKLLSDIIRWMERKFGEVSFI